MSEQRAQQSAEYASLQRYFAPELYARLVSRGAPSAVLQAACGRMRALLHSVATYVPANIVQRHLVQPAPWQIEGAFWNGSTLFADLSGFTALSATLGQLGKQGAEEVSAIINQLFGALTEEIHRHHGVLLKFGGDALTAFFDASVLGDNHALLASHAALAMQARMREFGALRTRGGTFQLRLRIGVHSGQVFAAEVGDAEHIELIVTGRTINRVALAQEIAQPGEVVISEETRALLPQATTQERQVNFHLLTKVAVPVPPFVVPHWQLAEGAGDLPELLALAARVDALQPYLPCHLPQRFLLPAEGALEAGEFRPVTVLFANFFPFSVVLELVRDDCPTALQVLNAYYRRAQAVIHRYGGIVNKVDMHTYGDKLMALFGAPTAHEDDPLRAVRAAFDLRAALAEANQEIAALLGVRNAELKPDDGERSITGFYRLAKLHSQFALTQQVGINTGVVFAGPVGGARRREYTVMGHHVNLAARLMGVAQEGVILLSADTRRAVERNVAVRERASVRLKGIAQEVPLAEALRPLAVPQNVRRSLARSPLVGRADELNRLLEVGRAALADGGRVVALIGDAGVGKTRLIEELLQQLVIHSGSDASDVPGFFPYSVECQSYEQNTSYAAVRELLRQFFDIASARDPQQSAAAVRQRVEALVPDLARFTPLLHDLIDVPLDETALTAALTEEQRHDRVQELVEALLLAEARTVQPLVLIVDDLHWIDASSYELLLRLTRQAGQASLLILLGYRPDPPLAEAWRDLPHCTRLALDELSDDEATALVQALLGGQALPEFQMLAERAQGNPFFIEEVVRGLIETGALAQHDGGWQLAKPLDEAALPNSIEGVITARLDRLEERIRDVLQVAAVIGRRFLYPILSGVVSERESLDQRLQRLTEADLIVLEELERELAYLFKHTLTRDVAYEAILYSRRRELHRSVAQQIEQVFAGRLDDQLALLARHYLLAEDWQPAFDYHLRAGRQAQRRYANREAIALLERGLEIGLRLAEQTTDDGRWTADERRMTEDRGRTTDDSQQGATSQSEYQERKPEEDAGRDHRKGAAGAGQNAVHNVPSFAHLLHPSIIEILERLGVVHALIGEYDTALARYQAALARLRQQPAAPLDGLVRLHHHIARVYEKRADFNTAFEWVERAIALAGEQQSAELARCLLLGAGLHKRQGRYQQALEWGEQALRMAEQIGNIREQAAAYKILGGTSFNLGNFPQALEFISQSLELYEKIQDLDGVSYAHNDLAVILHNVGQLNESRKHYESGFEIKRIIGDVYGQGMIACNLGELFRLQGNVDNAVAQYKKGLSIYQEIGSLYMMGVLHMNLGATYLLRNRVDLAGGHLQQSTALFSQAGAEDFLPELERYIAELHIRRGDLAKARLACEISLATAARLEARTEEGATRRTLGHILALSGDNAGAWEQLQRSLAILRAAASPHEIAKTLVALAEVAPTLDRRAEGQRALDEALPTLERVGALRDLREAREVAARHGYRVATGESPNGFGT